MSSEAPTIFISSLAFIAIGIALIVLAFNLKDIADYSLIALGYALVIGSIILGSLGLVYIGYKDKKGTW